MNLAIRLIIASLVFPAMDIHAHARWAEASEGGLTPARSSSTGLKSGPCGAVTRESDPDRPATVLQSGSELEIKIYQDIYHQGDYRIYFSPSNDEGLFEYDTATSTIISEASEEYTLIAAEELIDVAGQAFYDATISLPDIECDDCVLQMIQYMPDNPNNPYYYSCADIILTLDGTNPSDTADITPPEIINDFTAQPGDEQVLLNWKNPEQDYSETLILQSSRTISRDVQSGTVYSVGDDIGNATLVYKGRAQSQTINELKNGSTYYFTSFAVDANLNYSDATSLSVALDANNNNQAPLVSLIAEQNSTISTRFTTTDGLIIAQASVEDANINDSHSFDWSLSSPELLDVDNEESLFTFDPSSVPPGAYRLTVKVSDDAQIPLTTITRLIIGISKGILAEPPTEEPPVVEPPVIEPPAVEPPTIEDPENGASDEDTPTQDSDEASGGSMSPLLLLLLMTTLLISRGKRKHKVTTH